MSDRNDNQHPDAGTVATDLSVYIAENHAVTHTADSLPRDALILELVDSYGFIDTIAYLENRWAVSFEQDEQTLERLGSVNKMARAVVEKHEPEAGAV